jgi:hypothetical protein
MIKVNYDKETGRVIAFNKDITPYVEITEEERKQPLPDKYSYYAVVNGKFTIVRREPNENELAKDKTEAKAIRLAEIDSWFKANDWKVNKVFLGEWEATDTRWLEYLNKRAALRKEHEELTSKEVKV